MIFTIKCAATIEAPNDWAIEGNKLVLPNGSIIKPFITLEKNEMDDLTNTELEALGASIEYGESYIEEVKPQMVHYTLDETITVVNHYNVLMPASATYDEIRNAAYEKKPRIKFSEVQDVEIIGPDGEIIEPE